MESPQIYRSCVITLQRYILARGALQARVANDRPHSALAEDAQELRHLRLGEATGRIGPQGEKKLGGLLQLLGGEDGGRERPGRDDRSMIGEEDGGMGALQAPDEVPLAGIARPEIGEKLHAS